MKRTPLALLLLGALLLSACGSSPVVKEPTPTEVLEPAQPASEPSGADPGSAPAVLSPAEVDPPAAALLPGNGAQHGFMLSDGTQIEEHYVRDGGRLIGSYNGEPYVTWFITDQGIFRRDPKGPGLLRYLPPEPEDGLAWKQRSGDTDVWFNLQAVPQCQSPLGPAYDTCWQLTVLNRAEQTVYLFSPGPAPEDWLDDSTGVLDVRADNFANPAESFVKWRRQAQPTEPPSREVMLEGADPWPSEEYAPIQSVTLAEFRGEQLRQVAEAGWPVKEVDLNGDGEAEAVVGQLGQWHADPVLILDSRGNRLRDLHEWLSPPILGHVNLVTVPGVANPVLVTQRGRPEEWHSIAFEWMEGDQFVTPWGWHPKTNLAFGMDYGVLPDGTVEITGSLSGYTFVTRYAIERAPDTGPFPYVARQLSQQVTPGPYPTTAADLMTALFVARWYGLTDQIELYVPDPAVRAAFMGTDVGQVHYDPSPVRVGRLVDGEYGPTIEPAQPGPDGSLDFIASIQEYEGGSYWTGRVVIGTGEGGRLVVRELGFLDHGWAY